jgi:hypothetical protein
MSAVEKAREEFYLKLAESDPHDLKILMRTNQFINWQHPSLVPLLK